MHLGIVNPDGNHALSYSLLRTKTKESTSSRIVHADEGLFLNARSTNRTGQYDSYVHPSENKRASWKATIPFPTTNELQSFQSCSTASSRWSPSINRKSIESFHSRTAF